MRASPSLKDESVPVPDGPRRAGGSRGLRDSIGPVNLAPNWEVAAAGAAVLAIVALAARAVSWSGAVAGLGVGIAVAAGFGWPGMIVLGTFFVVGSVATRVGYAKKAARGTAEKRGGARDWRNVVGKGGVAAGVAIWQVFETAGGHDRHLVWHVQSHAGPFVGALAAALADTLGTEIGSLSRGDPFTFPGLRRTAPGTAGAVSWLGVVAGAAGSALVAIVALMADLIGHDSYAVTGMIAVAGLVASLSESLAVGMGLRAPGFVRNLLTTGVGAGIVGLGLVREVA